MRVEKAMVARSSWTKMAKELISSQVPPACGGGVVLPSSSGRALDDRVNRAIFYARWWLLSLLVYIPVVPGVPTFPSGLCGPSVAGR